MKIALKLHVGKEIYMDCYTFFHIHNEIVLQIVISIGKNKLYCADFYLNC